MFMISKLMFETTYRKENLIDIEPYEEKNHIGNFYYFRFGVINQEENIQSRDGKVVIPENGFVRFQSLERFRLSWRVMAHLGNRSALIEQGLQLIHSPTIDPGYPETVALDHPGFLTPKKVSLPIGEKVGKILFYDVSDTMIKIEEFHKSQLWKAEQEAKKEGLKTGFVDGVEEAERIINISGNKGK